MAHLPPDAAVREPAPITPPLREHPDAPAPEPAPAEYRPEEFPGCESFHLPASEIEHYDGRPEYRDGETETTWKVCEPTSIYHDGPSRRLVRMAERVAASCGDAPRRSRTPGSEGELHSRARPATMVMDRSPG